MFVGKRAGWLVAWLVAWLAGWLVGWITLLVQDNAVAHLRLWSNLEQYVA